MKFSPEIRLGELIAAVGVVGTVFMAWGNFNSRMTGIEASQAALAGQGQRLDTNIREVKDEVKDTGIRVRSLESRMDRARM